MVKGKGKGKGKGKKGKKKEKKEAEPVLEVIDENTKQFFLYQIKDLEEKLKRYQKKCDELELICKKYEGQYETLNNDRRDIINNLKKELEKRTDEIADLNDRLIGLNQAKDAEKDAYEKQLTDLRTEFQETKDILTNQNNSLLAKLTALEEFKTQKEDLLAKLSKLEETIKFLEADHKNKLNEIEKKVVIDKDKLKKEMIVKVSQVAAEFRRVSNKQMADTTKRTIRENVSINAQLQKMSDKVMELVNENDQFRISDKTFKQQLDLLEDNEKELCKKNISNLKILRLLTDKCRAQEQLICELEERQNELRDNEASHLQLISSLEQQLDGIQDSNEECDRLKEQTKGIQKELQASIKYRGKIEKVLKEATDAIILALSKSNAARDNGDGSNWNSVEKRDNMLEHLLILLNSAVTLGMGANPEVFGSTYVPRPRTSEYPGSGKGIKKQPQQQQPTDAGGTTTSQQKFFRGGEGVAHYKLGDLGIVPRKDEHILTNTEKMKLAQRELGNLQKLSKKTVATQTIDLVKASIFGVDEGPAPTSLHPIYSDRKMDSPRKNNPSKSLLPTRAVNSGLK